mmetsp:Transcript_14334/g.36614  ORF Transcript_14334/g.36614 Transcript_14334/m.36614 type:complete len:281 (-) Transcript_14334:539-1381(-)
MHRMRQPHLQKTLPSNELLLLPQVYYCDADCKKLHWPEHKPDCVDIEYRLVDLAWMGAPVSETCSLSRVPDDGIVCAICTAEDIRKPAVRIECGREFFFVCVADYFEYLRLVRTVSGRSDASYGVEYNALGCPKCRRGTLNHSDESIERSIEFCVMAKRQKRDSEEMHEFCRLAHEEFKNVEEYEGDQEHPGDIACQGLLALEVFGYPDKAIRMFGNAISQHKNKTERVNSIEGRRDEALAALESNEEKEAKRITEKAQQQIASLCCLTPDAFLDIQLKL